MNGEPWRGEEKMRDGVAARGFREESPGDGRDMPGEGKCPGYG
jgi:hypothetical protein